MQAVLNNFMPIQATGAAGHDSLSSLLSSRLPLPSSGSSGSPAAPSQPQKQVDTSRVEFGLGSLAGSVSFGFNQFAITGASVAGETPCCSCGASCRRCRRRRGGFEISETISNFWDSNDTQGVSRETESCCWRSRRRLHSRIRRQAYRWQAKERYEHRRG